MARKYICRIPDGYEKEKNDAGEPGRDLRDYGDYPDHDCGGINDGIFFN